MNIARQESASTEQSAGIASQSPTALTFGLSTLCFFLLTTTAHGAVASSNSKTRQKTPSAQLVSQAPVTKELRPIAFDSEFTYSVSSDFAQQAEPRLYTQRLSSVLGLAFNDSKAGKESFHLSLEIGAQYKSLSTQVNSNTSRLSDAFQMADTDFSGDKSFALGEHFSAEQLLNTALGLSLPTSDDSRFEGIRGVPFATLAIISKFGSAKQFSISNTLSGQHTINSYDYSPVSGEINSDFGASYALGFSTKFSNGFRFGVNGSVKTSRYLDGSNTVSLSNSETLSYSKGSLSAALRYTNGGHTLDHELSLWQVDQYRRVVALTLTYGM